MNDMFQTGSGFSRLDVQASPRFPRKICKGSVKVTRIQAHATAHFDNEIRLQIGPLDGAIFDMPGERDSCDKVCFRNVK